MAKEWKSSWYLEVCCLSEACPLICLELTLALHENLRHRSLWGMIGGRARCRRLEYPVSSKGNGQIKFVTWGCTAHVIMIECLAGTRKKGAGRTPGTKEWKGHSCTAFQGHHRFTGRCKLGERHDSEQGAACKITCTVEYSRFSRRHPFGGCHCHWLGCARG